MKSKHIFFRILPSLVLLMAFHCEFLCGQQSSSLFTRMAKTSDVIYINDSTYFLMDRSPLDPFPDYKRIYDGMLEFYRRNYSMYGWLISPDTTTTCMIDWCLKDSMLYMSDIIPNLPFDEIAGIFPNNELYRRMENLTGVKFDPEYKDQVSYTYKDYPSNPLIGYNTHRPPGAMPALWFNDTLLVKRAWTYGENLSDWEKESCRELVFKNGKLISVRIMVRIR